MTDQPKTGIDKAREIAHNLNGGKESTSKSEVDLIKETGVGMNGVFNNKELADMYNESAKMGSENIQQSMPMLKLHIANSSTNNFLEDGKTEPNDGYFFYTKTHEQFENPICHILSISRGFRADGTTDPKTGEKKTNVFNQIVSGVIINEGEYLPFIMYFTGTKLQNLWNFGKLVQPLTQKKPVGIPMFALSVKLSREKIDTDFGLKSVIKFELVKEGDNPVLVSDPGEFIFLRDLLVQTTPIIDSLIESKDTEGKDSNGNKIQDINFHEEEIPALNEEIEDIVIPENEQKKDEMPF